MKKLKSNSSSCVKEKVVQSGNLKMYFLIHSETDDQLRTVTETLGMFTSHKDAHIAMVKAAKQATHYVPNSKDGIVGFTLDMNTATATNLFQKGNQWHIVKESLDSSMDLELLILKNENRQLREQLTMAIKKMQSFEAYFDDIRMEINCLS